MKNKNELKTEIVSSKVSITLKKQFEAFCKELGTTPSQIIRQFIASKVRQSNIADLMTKQRTKNN